MIKSLVLITYDVNTQTDEGRRRLRHVAKHCQSCGQRVQNSVFECYLDAAQLRAVQNKLASIIDPATDSLRFYSLGNKYQNKIVHIGAKPAYDPEGTLLV